MTERNETNPPGEASPPSQAREDERLREKDRVSRLIGMAVELTEEVEELARDSGQQFTSLARTARKNRMMIWALVGSMLLDVVITVALMIVGSGVVDNTRRIDDFSQQLRADNTAQRQRALCPLYGIFRDSKSEAGRKAAPDKAAYDHAFEVIEDGYAVLGCAEFLKESGRDKW
jgi:hypothetical protein